MTTGESNRVEIRLRDPELVRSLLDELWDEIADVESAVVTSRDGIVIAAGSRKDAAGHLPDHASALAAAASGIGDNFIETLSAGRLESVLFESSRGCVGVYPLTSTLLLVLGSSSDVTPGRFMAAAKRVISTLQTPQKR